MTKPFLSVLIGTGGRGGLRSLFFAASGAWAAAVRPVVNDPPSRPFPEEATRAEWDRGCADWPVDFAPMRVEMRKGGGDLRVFTRLVLSPERGESQASLLASVERWLGDGAHYPAWVMPGINQKADGGRYFVTVENLVALQDPGPGHQVLTGDFNFKLLWFERAGRTSLLFRRLHRALPDCAAFKRASWADGQPAGLAANYIYRMIPREDLLDRLMAEIWVYPAGAGAEMRLRLTAKPAKLVYELMPETLVRAQLESRGLRIFENFVDFRRADALSRASNGGRGAPSKPAPPAAKAR